MDPRSLVQALRGFATGGLQGAGVPLPGWLQSNPVQGALQNPDNMAAAGMAIPNAQALAAALKAGKSYSQIAKDFDVTRGTVAGKVRDWGLAQDQSRIGYPRNAVNYRNTSVTPRDPNYTTDVPDWFLEEMNDPESKAAITSWKNPGK
jgi:hypothetical protein